jgi:cyclic pyranopterin phosphate synthase
MSELTHLDAAGNARMVDVAARAVTVRTATASGIVRTTAADRVAAGAMPKGDVLATARIAGIMGAKRTPDLIPLCHPIAVHGVAVDLAVVGQEVRIRAQVRTADRTGVEMEALTAVAVAGLTVIDMIKAVDPAASLEQVRVESKDGGRTGRWDREPQ